jgi:hypothetical protein
VKKLLPFFLIFAFILSSCAESADGRKQLLESLMNLSSADYTANITAVFPEREANFTIDYTYNDEKETASVVKPAEVSGITFSIEKENGTLSFDGLKLEVGRLDDFGTSPFTCLSRLVKSWKLVEFSEITKAEIFGQRALLAVAKADNIEYRTWFSKDSFLPLYAEVFSSGTRVIKCNFERAEHRR